MQEKRIYSLDNGFLKWSDITWLWPRNLLLILKIYAHLISILSTFWVKYDLDWTKLQPQWWILLHTSTYKFLAAPNPPGKMTASKSCTFRSFKSWIFPLAIRADSTKTFLSQKKLFVVRAVYFIKMSINIMYIKKK